MFAWSEPITVSSRHHAPHEIQRVAEEKSGVAADDVTNDASRMNGEKKAAKSSKSASALVDMEAEVEDLGESVGESDDSEMDDDKIEDDEFEDLRGFLVDDDDKEVEFPRRERSAPQPGPPPISLLISQCTAPSRHSNQIPRPSRTIDATWVSWREILF